VLSIALIVHPRPGSCGQRAARSRWPYDVPVAAYDYRCRVCDEVFEVRRAIAADAGAERCPAGHADVARVWSAVSVGGVAADAGPASSGACCGGGCCG
jgi:putative FmdB family regulatory protein